MERDFSVGSFAEGAKGEGVTRDPHAALLHCSKGSVTRHRCHLAFVLEVRDDGSELSALPMHLQTRLPWTFRVYGPLFVVRERLASVQY